MKTEIRSTLQTNATEAVCSTLDPETRWLLMRDLASRLERENENLRNALHLAESAYRDAIASSDKFESIYNDLRWLPLNRFTPTEDDANSCGDVEWSDGFDIWEAAYSNSKNATHWRSIRLPNS
jgi:hypothetical protein